MIINVRSFIKNGKLCISLLKSLYRLPDILILTETWLQPDDQEISNIEGYRAFHTIREGGRSGGVSIFCEMNLTVELISELTICNETIESCVIECRTDTDVIVVFAIYRPHSNTIEQFCPVLDNMLHSPILRNKSIMLTGDLNIDLLKHNTHRITEFMEMMQALSFVPLITKATKFPNDDNSAPSLLDHIWFNSLTPFSSGIIAIDLTDHCPIFLNLRNINSNKVATKIRLVFRVHHPTNVEKYKERIREMLSSADFDRDINDLIGLFVGELNRLYALCFPLKVKYVSPKRLSKPWLSSAILNSIKTKAQYFKWVKLGIISSELNRTYRNKLNSVIRAAKQRHFAELFMNNKDNIKQTWKVIKMLLIKNSSSKKIKSIIVNGETRECGEDIVEGFSDYFSSIAQLLDADIPQSDMSPLNHVAGNMSSSLFLNPVTGGEITNIILKLKNVSSSTNNIPVSELKQIQSLLADPIAKIVNSSFHNGIFPDILKLARVVPIFKSGDSCSVSNYRPISILPVLSKIFERCVAQRLMHFLLTFKLISSDQFGFRKGKSTNDAFIKLTEYIYRGLNNKEHCRGIFIDLRKAFDTVNHKILLKKLEKYGVRGLPLLWFTSYLKDRRQFVGVDGNCSQEEIINVGVPQCSILGPILFLIYINDLPRISSLFTVVLYADDTTLLASKRDYNSLMIDINKELAKI